MPISQMVAPHLPYLRRFARALSGSQASGDAYALAALEVLVADPTRLDLNLEPRTALFKVFLRVWASLGEPKTVPNGAPRRADRADDVNSSQTADERLDALTPRPRVAFVLNAIEGLSDEQIAQVLDVPIEEARALLREAGVELARDIATDILIIEDEPLIAMDLQSVVEALGHRVSGVARTHSAAVTAAAQHRPGLILADVQLADGSSGIDAVNEMLETFNVPVIFVTAFPERLLTGLRPEPTFVVSKPFRADMLQAVVSQALFFKQDSFVRPDASAFSARREA